jgi:hypothetical protein
LESAWAFTRLVGSNPTLSAMGDEKSDFEYRNKRGWLNRALEKVEDLPTRTMTGKRPMTDSAKRRLYEQGLPGRATVLKAPGEAWVSEVAESHGRFTVSVELPDREPYEAKVWQSFGKYEWDELQEGALVECRVDPGDEGVVMLCPPEQDELSVTVMDSSRILSRGTSAAAKVLESAPMGQTAPGTEDEFFLLNLELRSDAEPKPWKVQIGQRVPKGAEEMVAAGGELEAAYIEVDGGDSVAIDWPASSDGRFS